MTVQADRQQRRLMSGASGSDSKPASQVSGVGVKGGRGPSHEHASFVDFVRRAAQLQRRDAVLESPAEVAASQFAQPKLHLQHRWRIENRLGCHLAGRQASATAQCMTSIPVRFG